jgi:flagellar basal-body rod protein FlgB
MRLLFDTTMAAVEKGLDGTAARQRATAGNIANIETPNYAPRVVSFEDDLRKALASERRGGAERAVEAVAPAMRQDDVGPVRLDGNGVNIEGEVATMSKNTLQHQALLRLMGKKIEMMKLVMK